jgi:hypothetical protein
VNSFRVPSRFRLPSTRVPAARGTAINLWLCSLWSTVAAAGLPPMLDLVGTGTDPAAIEYGQLPVLAGNHAVITRGASPWRFRLHNYLEYHDGRYWCMWSHGPEPEDHPTQHVRYATSLDGLQWSDAAEIVGPSPQSGFRYIARGFWVRDGRLLALLSHDEAYNERGRVHFFGPSLELLAFEWNPLRRDWAQVGTVHTDAINNFPPRRLPTNEWAMTRRDHNLNVSMLIGGETSALAWQSWDVIAAREPGRAFLPGEPEWWLLPDNRLLAVYRDNGKSGRLFRSVSTDHGRTWTEPEKTNFPDARSKFFGLRTSRGFFVLVSNPNPLQRSPLCLSVSDDGITFTHMFRLPIPMGPEDVHFDAENRRLPYRGQVYPHALEHDGNLFIAYARHKLAIEIVKVSLEEIERSRRTIGPTQRSAGIPVRNPNGEPAGFLSAR